MALTSTQRASLQQAAETYAAQVDRELVDYLLGRGLTKDVSVGALLGKVCEPLPGHEQYAGRLCIPYCTSAGVVSLKFRALDDSQPKYMGLPGQHPRLYNVRSFHLDSPHIAIVEGELDALIMSDLVGVPAVSVPGAPIWLDHWPRCFADYETVFVVTDNDASNEQNPGQRLAHKIAESIRGCTVVQPPPDQDVSEWYLSGGRDAILDKMGLL